MAPKLKRSSSVLIANTDQMGGGSRPLRRGIQGGGSRPSSRGIQGGGSRPSRRGIQEESSKEVSRGNVNEKTGNINEEAEYGEEHQEKQVERDEAPPIPTRRRRLDPYGTDLFKSGLAVRPKNPYYVTKKNMKHPDWLCVSKDVFKHKVYDLPETALLMDEDGRRWNTRLCIKKDGRKIYQGGWKYFCENNHVKVDDLCIIEFVPLKNATHIRVKIVRAGGSS